MVCASDPGWRVCRPESDGRLRECGIRDSFAGDFDGGDGRARVTNKGDSQLLFAVDMAGTLLFGIAGATAAIAGNLDLLGVMVLAFATALAGGIIRDLLIGATPPASLRDWRYSAMAFTGGAIVFFCLVTCWGSPGPCWWCWTRPHLRCLR